MVELYSHQKTAIEMLKSGSILCGGVGSGKSRTAIAYYFLKICKGLIKINGQGNTHEMLNPKDLYIITTAKKRDTLEWERECVPFMLSTKPGISINGVNVVVDSWNNIKKYVNIKKAFFIFDEQRLVGSGTWVKNFIKISKTNQWILLSATPGDTWLDYIPVFVANGFYKNRTEFLRQHVVFSRFSKYPKVDRYIETSRLNRLRDQITINMVYEKPTIAHHKTIAVDHDKELFNTLTKKRWNVFKKKPVKTIAELCYLMRKVVNSDISRIDKVRQILKDHPKLIIFYNFNYELELLRQLCVELNIATKEWNGHNHQEVPKGDSWIYLVQYTAGAEGWNCIETNAIVFYSQNYSYKIMTQSAGRIDRLNTPFKDLYYYHLMSNSLIDIAISKALKLKKNFNINAFMPSRKKHML